jgi:hypothetical protein
MAPEDRHGRGTALPPAPPATPGDDAARPECALAITSPGSPSLWIDSRVRGVQENGKRAGAGPLSAYPSAAPGVPP